MKKQIQELIDHHKTAKLECQELINELRAIGETLLSEDEIRDLNSTIERYAQEAAWRMVFVSQLEDLL